MDMRGHAQTCITRVYNYIVLQCKLTQKHYLMQWRRNGRGLEPPPPPHIFGGALLIFLVPQIFFVFTKWYFVLEIEFCVLKKLEPPPPPPFLRHCYDTCKQEILTKFIVSPSVPATKEELCGCPKLTQLTQTS